MRFAALLSFIVYFLANSAWSQPLKLEDYGLRHYKILYKKDTVDILVQSKKGEELVQKPIILIERGSLPKPLLVLENGKPVYGIMPFRSGIFTAQYHLIYISKPFTPLMAEASSLKPDMTFVDPKTGTAHTEFTKRDNPEYYASRDLAVIKFLKKQPWADKKKLVLAGHSEGGGIMARVASKSKDATHLIYSNANPMGRMMSIISSLRADDDSVGTYTDQQFEFWKTVVEKQKESGGAPGFSYKSLYDFSVPPLDFLQKLNIPVLVSYSTRDSGAPFTDFMRLQMIRDKKQNFTFAPYIGLEHNYFGFTNAGQVDYNNFNWNRVAEDWLKWLQTN